MKPTRARIAAILILILTATAASACGTTPKPIKHDTWQDGASSAANAAPTPGVQTAREANVRAETVVATAMQAVVSRQAVAAKKPDDKRPAPVIAVADLGPSENLHQTPGPESSAEAVAKWLSTAWSRDKSTSWIKSQLNIKIPTKLEESRVELLSGDFDGDDKDDLAASFFADCAAPGCAKGGQWTVGVVWGESGWSRLATSQRFAPEFLGPADLTGDDHPELIFTTKQCGAHTCYVNVQVLSGHGDQRFRRILYLGDDVEGYGSRGLPQEVEVVEPVESDDVEDALPWVEVSGGQVGSAGAGVFQRISHAIWAWKPSSEKLEQVGTRWEPSNLRLHRFHDAIVALDRGNTGSAKKLLTEVIDSDKLDELPPEASPEPGLAEAMRTQLAHTARFMLARLALEDGDSDTFVRLRDQLQSSAPESPATKAVVALDKNWRGPKNAAKTCAAAAETFPEAADDDWVLDSLQLGYNAPVTFDADFTRGLCAGLEAR